MTDPAPLPAGAPAPRIGINHRGEKIFSLKSMRPAECYPHYINIYKTPSANLRDELTHWEKCRHVSSSEASVRLLGIDIHLCEPAVSVLPIHREQQQEVVFNEDDSERLEEATTKYDTLLLRYFWRPKEYEAMKYLEYHEAVSVSRDRKKRGNNLLDDPSNLPEGPFVDRHFVNTRARPHVCRLARIPLSNDTREDFLNPTTISRAISV